MDRCTEGSRCGWMDGWTNKQMERHLNKVVKGLLESSGGDRRAGKARAGGPMCCHPVLKAWKPLVVAETEKGARGGFG